MQIHVHEDISVTQLFIQIHGIMFFLCYFSQNFHLFTILPHVLFYSPYCLISVYSPYCLILVYLPYCLMSWFIHHTVSCLGLFAILPHLSLPESLCFLSSFRSHFPHVALVIGRLHGSEFLSLGRSVGIDVVLVPVVPAPVV